MPLKHPASEYGEYYREDGRRVRYLLTLRKDDSYQAVERASEATLARTPTRTLRALRKKIAWGASYHGPDLRYWPEKYRKDAVEFEGELHSPDYVTMKEGERRAIRRINAELYRRAGAALRRE